MHGSPPPLHRHSASPCEPGTRLRCMTVALVLATRSLQPSLEMPLNTICSVFYSSAPRICSR